jgi:hypothetical protein
MGIGAQAIENLAVAGVLLHLDAQVLCAFEQVEPCLKDCRRRGARQWGGECFAIDNSGIRADFVEEFGNYRRWCYCGGRERVASHWAWVNSDEAGAYIIARGGVPDIKAVKGTRAGMSLK